MSNYAERLKTLIKSLNISQNKFADMVGTSSARISHLCTGRNNPDAEMLTMIVLAFPSVNINWLLTGIGDMFIQSQTFVSEPQAAYGAAQVSELDALRQRVADLERIVALQEKLLNQL